MLAVAGIATVAAGGIGTMIDIEKRTAISESFADARYNEDIEQHIRLQWFITGAGVLAYFLFFT